MKFPVIGGVVFLLSGVAAVAAVAVMNAPKAKTSAAPQAVAMSVTDAAPVAVEGTPTELVFSVPDMHCEFACAPKVRETLAAVPGVEKVETDVETQTATIVAKSGFDARKAIVALTEAGYPAAVKE